LPILVLNYLFWFKPPKSILTYVPLIFATYIGGGINHSIVHYYAATNGVLFAQVWLVLIIKFGCWLTAMPVDLAAIGTTIVLFVYAISNYMLGYY